MRITAAVLAAVFATGCHVNNPKIGSVYPVIVPTPTEFTTAPDTLKLNGYPVVLRASLYRDFMPVSPPNGRSLTVSATVAVPAMQFLGLAVLRGSSTWITRFEPAVSIPEVIAVRAEGGPKWGPDEYVDVVVRFRMPTGEERLLAARRVLIGRSD